MAQQIARHGARVLSVLEKAKLVCWFEETNSFTQVARRYRAEFGMDPPQMDAVKKLHQRFLATGSILNGQNGTTATKTALGLTTDNQPQPITVTGSVLCEVEEQLKMARI